MMLHGLVGELKLITIKLRDNWKQSTLYHVEHNQHTQNIQINKAIGGYKECVFYFTEKSKKTFWPTQYTSSLSIYLEID